MKVRLLQCIQLHLRVSLASCGKQAASKRAAGTHCARCPVGAAVRDGTPVPTTWPEPHGGQLEYVETRVHGTIRKADALPVRRQKTLGVPRRCAKDRADS